MASMGEAVQEYQENPDGDLPINTVALCVDPIVEDETFQDYNEDGTEIITFETGVQILIGHTIVVTTGGPHAEFRTFDNGETYRFHYWDWFGSDEFSCGVYDDDLQTVQEAFGLYFDCLEDSQKAGAVVE